MLPKRESTFTTVRRTKRKSSRKKNIEREIFCFSVVPIVWEIILIAPGIYWRPNVSTKNFEKISIRRSAKFFSSKKIRSVRVFAFRQKKFSFRMAKSLNSAARIRSEFFQSIFNSTSRSIFVAFWCVLIQHRSSPTLALTTIRLFVIDYA